MATITGIYRITNTLNGKCYIGQSVNIHIRWSEHKRKNRNDGTAICRAIKKYGLDVFKFEVVVVCDKLLLDWHERLAILGHGSLAPNGYNLSTGGRKTTWAYKPSAETLHKRSVALKGKVRTEETKKKMSDAQKGKTISDETRKKLSIALKGRVSPNKGIPMSDSAKEKMIASKIGKEAPHRWVKVVRSDGVVFKSIKDAAIATNCTSRGIIRVLNKQRKLIYGYSFEYAGGVPSQL